MSFEPLQPLNYRIEERVQETANTFTIVLEPVDGQNPDFTPGQFNMLYAFGIGEVPISMSAFSDEKKRYVHTIKVVGKVTQALSSLQERDILGVRGPFGIGWPLDRVKGKDVLILAGGIGLAPLKTAMQALLCGRACKRVFLLYGARDPADRLYVDDLKKWNDVTEGNVFTTVDFADDTWKGNVGVVTTLIPSASFDPENTIAFLCGPEIMMRFAARELLQRKVTADNIFLSLERNMKCAIGHCGRCQFVQNFICKDGPVFSLPRIEPFFWMREL